MHINGNLQRLIDGSSILVTGGTGSFGRALIRRLLTDYKPKRVIIFSRDELKQFEMRTDPSIGSHPALRYFIGDIRDEARLNQALRGVDLVVHTAALKQVPACEYNPFEAIKTNVIGGQNLVMACIEQGVQRLVALSTDKACNPVNLYGATKLCSDKLFVAGNAYAGSQATRFCVVRYGNVVGSRGSAIPLFARLRKTGVIPITHPEMTRFWITLNQGVDFVLASLGNMVGGEIFVPKIPSMKMVELAKTIAPDCRIEICGIRPGEKIHEQMISRDDARHTLESANHYIIQPQFPWWDAASVQVHTKHAKPVPEGFCYSSELNTDWLTPQRLRDMIQPYIGADARA